VRQIVVPMERRRAAYRSADMRVTVRVDKKTNFSSIKYPHFESRFLKKAQNTNENVKYDRVELNCAVINRSRTRDLACLENRLLLRLPGPCSILGFVLKFVRIFSGAGSTASAPFWL